MAIPRDISDLYLAPLALRIDAVLQSLEGLSDEELLRRIALETDREPRTSGERHDYLLRAVTHLEDLHHWVPSWDERGLRFTHDEHTFVLGVPENVRRYLGLTVGAGAA